MDLLIPILILILWNFKSLWIHICAASAVSCCCSSWLEKKNLLKKDYPLIFPTSCKRETTQQFIPSIEIYLGYMINFIYLVFSQKQLNFLKSDTRYMRWNQSWNPSFIRNFRFMSYEKRYDKFWSISLEHFIRNKYLIS